MSLIKVASLPSLQGAAVRSSVWQRSSQAQARESGSRRRSLDTPRPRSRASSSHDLVSLDLENDGADSPAMVGGLSIPLRIPTPPPSGMDLWPLAESPVAFSSSDALSHMAKLSSALYMPSSPASSTNVWATNPAPPVTTPVPVSISGFPDASPASEFLAPAQVVTSAETPVLSESLNITGEPPALPTLHVSEAAPAEKAADPVPSAEPCTAPVMVAARAALEEAAAEVKESKGKRAKGKRVGPASRPGPDEVRIYRGTLNFDYVQELLDNITHVQRMFRGVLAVPSSTGAAAAVAAARMLSRSLSRSAVRVKGSVKDPVAVRLPEEALATLAEFGWVDVVTEDPEQAKLMGCLDAEIHNVATGHVAAYQRPAPAKSWFMIGEALLTGPLPLRTPVPVPSMSAPVSRASSLGGDALAAGSLSDPENMDAVETDVKGARVVGGIGSGDGGAKERVSLPPRVGGRGALTLDSLADHLSAAGQQIMVAAGLMQQWLDEQKEVAMDSWVADLVAEAVASPEHQHFEPAAAVGAGSI